VTSAPAAPSGTVVTANVSCPAGKVVLGGGAETTTSKPDDRFRFAFVASYPSDASTWRASGVVTVTLSSGATATITPYALCSL
jgi:hypothetical protein